MQKEIEALNERFARESRLLERIREETGRVIVGQRELIDRLLIALLCDGHVLIEGVPGLGKTLAVKTLAATLDASFRRIQFTPDLLPGDLIGTMIYNVQKGTFVPHRGPLFSQIILADEINRSPAKVQSALLEAMQEHQVTIGDTTFPLPRPFMVLATQNPIEQEGTYPLPEAQVDRFMFKVRVAYPTEAEEQRILRRMARTEPDLEIRPVVRVDELLELRTLVNEVVMDDRIEAYILRLVRATRDPEGVGLPLGKLIRYGASPRAAIYLALATRAAAMLAGRGYVVPHDVKTLAPDVLRHRVIVSYEAWAEQKSADDIVREILEAVPVP